MIHFLKAITIILFVIESTHGLSCVDETGSYVDWFIVYKVPKLETSKIKTLKSGFGYAFITDKTTNSIDWTLSKKFINRENSIFGQTIGPVIGQMNKASDDMSYVVYNDQTPDSTSSSSSSSSAHSKGLFAIDSEGGFWLMHSVPKFPTLSGSYKYPGNGKHNGQTAICISIDSEDTKTIDNVAVQLLFMRPRIYDISISDDLKTKAKHWSDLERKKWTTNDTKSQLSITSKNGLIFTSFAKSDKFAQDLYSDLIANSLKDSLLVQSWRNGGGKKLESNCSDKYKVQNIDKIQLLTAKSSSASNNLNWNSTEDHSKWVITSDNVKNRYTCISDINRMKSQFKRGGGSICIKSNDVWNIFKRTVESIEGCRIRSA